MTAPIGTAGTAGSGYRVTKPEGRHRAPPVPPRPDRWTVPIAAAAAILTAASLLAIVATGIGADASAASAAATGNGATVTTAARTARTVHVPLTILPAPVPVIGGPGIWDPETDAQIPVSAPVPSRTVPTATRTFVTPEAVSEPLVANTDTSTPEQQPATEPTATTTPSPTSTAAATTSSAPTEETTVTAEPTATETAPTDIGDVIDQALEDAIGETP